MDIQNFGTGLPTTKLQSSKNILPQTEGQKTSGAGIKSTTRQVDMRNVSLTEINQLIKSGVDGLLDALPVSNIGQSIRLANGSPSDREALMNQKVDFIGQIEKSIAFEKSRGLSTAFLENILANLNRIDGMNLPDSMDMMA
ncbi:MAG: hypothetical protein GXP06_13285 [Alphaproteobacteria bacterium]|nr:hypothetical protein [Alphaproteobacteria bacterium]